MQTPLLSLSILTCCVPGLVDRPVRKDTPAPTAVRKVRVLVAANMRRVRVRSDSVLSCLDGEGTGLERYPPGQWIDIAPAGPHGLRVGSGRREGDRVRFRNDAGKGVALSLPGRQGSRPEDRVYPGSLRVVLRKDGLLDVINEVDVERYVECVVAGEVWPTFATEAFRAQAIAARTFVLYQMLRRRRADYDVLATQDAQVYTGLREGATARKAQEATHDTRGLALTWNDGGVDRLFSAYYSAVCGGRSQSAAIFGQDDDIPPLVGGVRCDFCKIAPGQTYRWGPVRVPLAEADRRLREALRDPPASETLTHVSVLEKTEYGRAVRVRLKYSKGARRDMLAERFRLALDGNRIKSTDFDLRSAGGMLLFEHGHGYGHGLGLCQWGMEGQALQGRRAGEILRYYYPGTKLTRVY